MYIFLTIFGGFSAVGEAAQAADLITSPDPAGEAATAADQKWFEVETNHLDARMAKFVESQIMGSFGLPDFVQVA